MGKKRQAAVLESGANDDKTEESPMAEIDPVKEIKASPATSQPSKPSKRKRDDTEAAESKGAVSGGLATGDDPAERKPTQQQKKKRRKEKSSDETGAATAGAAAADGTEEGADEEAKPTAARFIVFVGNLPYTATEAAVRAHFAAVSPTSVRLLTERGSKSRCRGVAFVEFGRYDHMKTCLQKLHHTDFDDGVSPVRKINVELTAGGGGKTKARKDKIQAKNAKLNEERARLKQQREKEAAARAAEAGARDADAGNMVHPERRRRAEAGTRGRGRGRGRGGRGRSSGRQRPA